MLALSRLEAICQIVEFRRPLRVISGPFKQHLAQCLLSGVQRTYQLATFDQRSVTTRLGIVYMKKFSRIILQHTPNQ